MTVTHYITLNEKTLGRGGQVGRAGGGMGDARARQGQGRGSEQRSSDRIPEYLSAENISGLQLSSPGDPCPGMAVTPSRDDVTRTGPPWVRPPVDCWQRAGLSVIVRGNDASKQCCNGVRFTTELVGRRLF